MASHYEMFPAVVTRVEQLTPLIKRFTFKRQDGQNFPRFSGGSHIIVKMNEQLSNALLIDELYTKIYQLTKSAFVRMWKVRLDQFYCMISAMKAVKSRFQNQKIYFH